MAKEKHVHEPLFHLTKRLSVSPFYAWGIRIGAFIISMLLCAIVAMLISNKVTFGLFFGKLFEGTFKSMTLVKEMMRDLSVLLLLALAVTPCFKMRYWNIGGEGQAMMGAVGAAWILRMLGGKIPTVWTFLLGLVVAVVFAVVWAVIPALCKAKWNTNETLLTLMFNYIATCLGAFLIKSLDPGGTGVLDLEKGSWNVNNYVYLIVFIIATFVTVFMFVYLKYSKHGYEVTVVGESPNTARYIGVKTKLVVIRTLILCGIIGGIVGFMLVAIKDRSLISSLTDGTTVGGRGFTAILISWLANFNPFAMALVSFLVIFITKGTSSVGDYTRLGASFSSIMVGIFFFMIIATEFFINYKITFRTREKTSSIHGDRAEGSPTSPKEAEQKDAVGNAANEETKTELSASGDAVKGE